MAAADEQVRGDLAANVGQGDVLGQHLVQRRTRPAGHQAQVQGRVRLRVEVQDERPVPLVGQRRGEVDRRGGLADPPFLVQYGDPSHRSGVLPHGRSAGRSARSAPRPFGWNLVADGSVGRGVYPNPPDARSPKRGSLRTPTYFLFNVCSTNLRIGPSMNLTKNGTCPVAWTDSASTVSVTSKPGPVSRAEVRSSDHSTCLMYDPYLACAAVIPCRSSPSPRPRSGRARRTCSGRPSGDSLLRCG